MKKKEKPKWHKEWDRTYGKILEKETGASCGDKVWTMNLFAKQFIGNLLDKRTKELFERHNLLVLTYEKINGLKYKKAKIRRMISGHIQETREIKRDLIKMLKNL